MCIYNYPLKWPKNNETLVSIRKQKSLCILTLVLGQGKYKMDLKYFVYQKFKKCSKTDRIQELLW